tara:strand:+ start:402 stop:1151 length:750 start_codon:yes stop_codon:yes gene_type:complete
MSAKRGLITGCGKGIGLAVLNKLLTQDNDDLILGISRSDNTDLINLRSKFPQKFIFKECDISDVNKVQNILVEFNIKYGSIDYSICNAGIRSRLSMLKSELALYREVIETNTIANINISKIIIQSSLEANKKCNILFISSIVGSRGFDELTTYAVSKSALEGFVKSAAVEFGKFNIQLNCLAPGFVESSYFQEFKKNKKDLYDWTISQTPLGRWGKCDEIAELALFLISDKNSFMTGSVIYSDGGWTSK